MLRGPIGIFWGSSATSPRKGTKWGGVSGWTENGRERERGISTCGNSIIIVVGGGVTIIIFIWALLP